jgi:hypothetical protein
MIFDWRVGASFSLPVMPVPGIENAEAKQP